MSVLPDTPENQKEEIERDAVFIEQYRKTGDPIVACVRAGIRDPRYPISYTAERQLAKPEIQRALETLKNEEIGSLPPTHTRESIIAELQEVQERALRDSQYNATISAIREKAGLLGYRDQKINVTSNVNVTHMTNDQLMRIIDNGPSDAVDRALTVIDVENEQ